MATLKEKLADKRFLRKQGKDYSLIVDRDHLDRVFCHSNNSLTGIWPYDGRHDLKPSIIRWFADKGKYRYNFSYINGTVEFEFSRENDLLMFKLTFL